MGALGFDDFKYHLKLRAGNRSDLETASGSSFNYYGIWANLAYVHLCTQDHVLGLKKNLYFPQLFTSGTDTTVDGTAYIDVPSDCLYITEVYDTTNNVKLKWIPWKKYIGYTDRTTAASEGDATEWHHRGAYVYLHPTPSTTGDTMTMYYKKRVANLTGSETTLIGAEWDEPIIELASYKMFTWLHEYDKSKFCRESFLEMAASLADIYYNERKDTNETWQPSDSYMG